MLRQRKKQINPMMDLIKFLFDDGHQLTQNQKKKCYEKFESFKALGSSVISKNQLKKILQDLGRKISEQQLLQMIEQADPNGYGYVSYEAFEKIIELRKQKKQEEFTDNIELTFEDILKAQRTEKKAQYLTRISWQFLQKYLIKHFELQINIKSMKSSNSTDSLGKQEFKTLFT